jgi:sporulation protein YlmC with PRC-barrel domain
MMPGGARAVMTVAAGLALTACGTLRSAPPAEPTEAAAPPPSAPIIVVTPPPTPPTTEIINPPMPSCLPEETKPKPKPRPKPAPVHTAAPPQLPTAPTVAETPAGGIVNAQERAMAVPVMSILGKQVKGPQGEDLGRVVDVLADASGRVRIAIIDFGGFMGVGDRRIAVDWPLLRFNPDGGDPSLLLAVGMNRLKSAKEYKGSLHPETLMEPEASGASPSANNK